MLVAIEQLDYRPAENGRALARGHRDALGVVVPGVTLASVVERLRGALEARR